MRAPAVATSILFLAGCGGDEGPSGSVLTTVEVVPAAATIFSLPPANTVTLSALAKDQEGRTMADVGPIAYASSNETVATVDAAGLVAAVSEGTADVTATATAGGVTRSGAATVDVQVAPATATVMAPAFVYQPADADVSAGGSVTCTFGSIHHSVTFTTAGSPESIPDLESGSESRVFPGAGVYDYYCTFHPNMRGRVRVH